MCPAATTISSITQAHPQSLGIAGILMSSLFTLSFFTGASLLISFLFFFLLSLFSFLPSFLFLTPQPKNDRQILTQFAPTSKVWEDHHQLLLPALLS